jgi:hypothetical protein
LVRKQTIWQPWVQFTKTGQNTYTTRLQYLPNFHKKLQMVTKCSTPKPSKISHNRDFWYGNITFGDPGLNPKTSIYNASVVNFYNDTGSLARFENKNTLFYFEKTL